MLRAAVIWRVPALRMSDALLPRPDRTQANQPVWAALGTDFSQRPR